MEKKANKKTHHTARKERTTINKKETGAKLNKWSKIKQTKIYLLSKILGRNII
jgi:hypothetical protein